MWNRKELKERAKGALRRSYWKAVLVGLLLLLLVGGSGASSGFGSGFSSGLNSNDNTDYNYDYNYNTDIDTIFGEYGIGEAGEEIDGTAAAGLIGFIAVFIIAALLIAAVIMIFAILLSIFIGNPLLVGVYRFFNKSLDKEGKVKELAYTFDNGYKNGVKIMFFKDLFTILWTLLFIIPGIIKSYEYMMIPYILSDNPEISREEAFAQSRKMMYGNKWKAFVLDLSFIGWEILSALTLGILGIFYVTPYKAYTKAALYRKLSGADNMAAVTEQ